MKRAQGTHTPTVTDEHDRARGNPGRPPWWSVLGTLLAAPLFIGALLVYVPYSLTSWRVGPPFFGWSPLRWVGVALIVLAVPVVLDFLARFVREGHGTPVPVAPPSRLVVSGCFRFVRNPAYLAAIALLVGQALYFGSTGVLGYALAMALVFHLFVVGYEEPTLRATFGQEYDAYCQRVGRWIPRRPRRDRSPSRSRMAMMLCSLLASILGEREVAAQVYASRVTGGGDVRLHVTNHGVIGNSFSSRAASLEYPGGSGYEHLTHGGVWVGARAVDGSGDFIGVATGAVDAFLASTSSSLTEYSPLGSAVAFRSSIPSSPNYSPDALSDDETLVIFDDHEPKTALGSPEPNRPMGFTVRQLTHAWSKPFYRDFVIVRYVITSTSAGPLRDIWVGLYTELASGNKNSYANWPPSGSWFRKKLIQWDPAYRMLREHYCFGLPVPSGCNFQLVPPWVGVQLLTDPGSERQVTLAAWDYAPGDAGRDEDIERYSQMSAGTIADLTVPWLQPRDGDPTELLATGPFQLPQLGDSVEVAFALVGGADVGSLQQHARSAQVLADAGYRIEVVSAPSSPGPARLALTPSVNPGIADVLEFVVELPEPGVAKLELLDLAGRRVATTTLGSLSAGAQRVRFAPGTRLAPGVYLARLIHVRGTAVARVVRLGS